MDRRWRDVVPAVRPMLVVALLLGALAVGGAPGTSAEVGSPSWDGGARVGAISTTTTPDPCCSRGE